MQSGKRVTPLTTKNIKYYEVQQTDRDLHRFEWLFKNYDDTGIDKGAWHTKQIVAELIEPGGWTKYFDS